ncbi:MAG: hypothetical protein ACETWB_01835 [Anaerolineae bacterium]
MSEINVNHYSPEQAETLLLSYEGLVQELPELAASWDEMDAMELSHHQAMFGQAWGNRYLLGTLFHAGKLTAEQETRLGKLDRQLLEQSEAARACYALTSREMMRLFLWGTPLALSHETVRVEFDPAALNEMVLAWASE